MLVTHAKLRNPNRKIIRKIIFKRLMSFPSYEHTDADFIIDLNFGNMQNKKSLDKIRRINNLKHHKKR